MKHRHLRTLHGLDFLGPLYVSKKGDAQDAVSSEKTYVCLYACASTRAIHLELTPDLTVPSFLRSFRRFVSRFGLPATLISDNAKTFTSASRELENITVLDRSKFNVILQIKELTGNLSLNAPLGGAGFGNAWYEL
jgi:hypothetical protein